MILDFSAVVDELVSWTGRPVTVTVGHVKARHPAAVMRGALGGPVGQEERFEETRGLLGAVVLGDLDPEAREMLIENVLTPTAGDVLYFAVGSDLPGNGGCLILDESKFTAAMMGESLSSPPTSQLTLMFGDVHIGVTLLAED